MYYLPCNGVLTITDRNGYKAMRKDPEVELPLKQFTPKNKNLVLLEDYTKVLGEEYWDQWDKHEYIVTMDWQEILGEKLLG